MNRRIALSTAIAALFLGSGLAWSDGDRRYPLSATYKEECGGCHVAYPPQFLPARAWKSIMAGLDRHFGSDASLEAAKAKEIDGYLAAGAAPADRFGPSGDNPRITETPWFKRQHRDGHDGLVAAVWKSPAVRSPANCGACHRNAAAGNYGEDDIVIPRAR